MSTRLLLASLFAAAIQLSACGDDDKTCNSNNACGSGFRCVEVEDDKPKICVACDAEETRYDGIDNDCNPRTKDSDLDDDGDNWRDAPVSPGGDCDDNNFLISSRSPEVCGDGLDNDCDDIIDEVDCGDREGPTVQIEAPARGSFISETVDFVIVATDDVGVARLRLILRRNSMDTELASRTFLNTQVRETFSVDTNPLDDGRVTFIVEAIDVADRVARAMIDLTIDNRAPPIVTVLRPAADRAYGGSMTIEARAEDGSGVASMALALDGATLVEVPGVGTSSLSARYVVRTSSLAEGAHRLTVSATDEKGFSANTEVMFDVDNTAPAVAITAPIENATLMGTVMVTVHAEDNRRVEIIRFDTQNASPNAASVDQVFTVDTFDYPNGQVRWNAEVFDGVVIDDLDEGGHRASATRRVLIDNIRPEPTVGLSPADGTYVIGNWPITVDATSDVGAMIGRVTISVDGVLLASDTVPQLTRSYDFSRLPGPHQIEVMVTDNQNLTTVAIANVTAAQAPLFDFPAERKDLYMYIDSERLGDLDGDGTMDALGYSTASLAARLYRGIERGSEWHLGESVRLSLAYYLAKFADADGDGTTDLVSVVPGVGGHDVFLLDMAMDPPREYISYGAVDVGEVSESELGDIDGDGDVDLIGIAGDNIEGYDLSVLLQEDHQFAISATHPLTDLGVSQTLRFADLEGDGDLDVVLCTDRVITFLNEDGVFGQPIETAVVEDQLGRDCAVGDITGDGTLDVLASAGSSVVTMVGAPSMPGHFIDEVHSPIEAFGDLELIDLNGDARLDAAIGNGNYAITLGIAESDGSLTRGDRLYAQSVFSGLRAIDLDGDGDHDLAASFNGGEGTVYVWENDGAGNFPGALSWDYAALNNGDAAPAHQIATGDFSGGSELEVAYVTLNRLVIAGRSGDALVPLQSSALDFSASRSLAAGDVDQLGFDDLVVSTDSVRLDVYLNQGNATFNIISDTTHLGDDVALGDLDGDGASELVSMSTFPAENRIDVLHYDANTQQLVEDDTAALSAAPNQVRIADLFGDPAMRLDLIIAEDSGLTIRTFDGTNYVTAAFPLGREVVAAAAGDVDGDGIVDLALATELGVELMLGRPGGAFAPSVLSEACFRLRELYAADFTGDVRAELIGRDEVGPFLLVPSPAGGFFPRSSMFPTWEREAVEIADMSGDGKPDLMLGGPTDLIRIDNKTP